MRPYGQLLSLEKGADPTQEANRLTNETDRNFQSRSTSAQATHTAPNSTSVREFTRWWHVDLLDPTFYFSL